MRKLLLVLCALMLCFSTAEARSHGGHHHSGHFGGPTYHFAPKHHHHHGSNAAAGLAVGLIGGAILNTVLSQPRVVTTTAYSSMAYAPVVTSPSVVSTTTTTSPCYTTSNIVTGATATHCSSTIITGNPTVSQFWYSN